MKAMIFAAGLGSRLKPLTNSKPKALVEVGGKTMLERTILRLKHYGFSDITINIHHFGQQIIDYLKANNDFGVNIHICDEHDLLLDTGGGILNARHFLEGDEPFLVHNVDIASDINLKALYDHHLAAKADVTLVVSNRETTRKLLFDKDNKLVGWRNSMTGETKPDGFSYDCNLHHAMAFGGIHVLSSSVFSEMGSGTQWTGCFPIIPFYLSCCQKLLLKAYEPDYSFWFDIGKHETLAKANDYLSKNNI